MNDIIIQNPGSNDLRTTNVVRINRSDDLQAGTYWRAKDDVPELTKPEKRQRGIYLPEGHPDYIKERGFNSSNHIGYEEYEVEVPIRGAIPEGRMHLLQNLKLVDNEIHAVVLLSHPSESRKKEYTYLVDEFLHYFELVDEKEAQKIRQEEIDRMQKEIVNLQQSMIAGPPSDEPVALLGAETRLPAQPSVTTMVANIQHIEKLSQTADKALAIATKQSNWIKEHAGLIAEKTQALLPFYQEKSSAALASTSEIMRYAANLQKGVQSIGLYTGQGVEVRRLAEGKSADPTQKLVIHREMLFMDEEYLVNLDRDPDMAGADSEDFDDFVAQITKSKSLRDRIFPFERMVVLMRYRRNDKKYMTGNSLEAALVNDFYNQANRVQFLLVRDGENYWQIWSELTTQVISSLYPTNAMGNRPFRGVDGTQIGLKDLNFADAKGKFDDLNQVYKNLLVLLWGLNDREQIFGPFYNPDDYTSNGFMDEAFQHKYFIFWDPYEQGNIGTGRPRFDQWLREKNSWIRSGSRVIVMRNMLACDSALGKNDMTKDQPDAIRKIDDKSYEYLIRKTKKGLVVGVQAGRTIYPKERLKDSYYFKQTYDVVIDPETYGYDEYGSLKWLCLDMIDPADIDHYLESRLDRPRYMNFYDLLLKTRKQLQQDAVTINPLIEKLVKAYQNAPETKENTDAEKLARQAIQLWRCGNRGAMPPAANEDGHQKVYKTMLSSMWTIAGNNHPIEAAEQLCAAEGRKPLRLSLTGKDKFAVYATSVGDEIEERLFRHVWVTRLSCERKKDGLIVKSKSIVLLDDKTVDEKVLHEWEDAKNHRDVKELTRLRKTRYLGYGKEEQTDFIDYADIRKTYDKINSMNLEFMIKDPYDLEFELEDLNYYRMKHSKNSVADLVFSQPIGIVSKNEIVGRTIEGFVSRSEYEYEEQGYYVLTLLDDPYVMHYRRCVNDTQRQLVISKFIELYKRKDLQKTNLLERAGKPPAFGMIKMAYFARKPFKEIDHNGYIYRENSLEADWYRNLVKHSTINDRYSRQNLLPELKTEDVLKYMREDVPYVLNTLCEKHGWTAKEKSK